MSSDSRSLFQPSEAADRQSAAARSSKDQQFMKIKRWKLSGPTMDKCLAAHGVDRSPQRKQGCIGRRHFPCLRCGLRSMFFLLVFNAAAGRAADSPVLHLLSTIALD